MNDVQRLERVDKMMIRWMCEDMKSSDELRQQLGIVSDRVRLTEYTYTREV